MICQECHREVPEQRPLCLYCGAPLGEWLSGEGLGDQEAEKVSHMIENIPLHFSMTKTKRSKPLNRITLVFVFFAAAFFGGFFVWVMR